MASLSSNVSGLRGGATAFATSPYAVPAIFALALLLRLALIVALPQQPFSDGAFYFPRAIELASGQGYQEAGFPTAFWPVGYPALLAASMMIFGKSLLASMLLNLAAAALILWLILWFGRHVAGSETAARIAALLYAFYPAHIAYTGATLSETAYTAVAMGAFALLIARRNDWKGLLLAGAIFGGATLMRPQTMFFPFGAIIALAFVYRSYRWVDVGKAMLIVYVALAAVVLPWSFRNERVLGSFALVSTNGGVALYTGANDEATGDWFAWEHGPLWAASGIAFEDRIEKQVELDRRFRALASDWIRENPGRYLALMSAKIGYVWLKDADGFWTLKYSHPSLERPLTIVQWINQLYYAALLLAALVCFAAATRAQFTRDERQLPLGLLLCMPLFVTLLAAAFTGQNRYHYPAMPFVIVAAGWTLAALLRRRRAT